jgi:putative ABC transport system permease protein
MRDLLSDLRYVANALRRHKGFAATAVVTLGLAVAANATAFSLVNAVLLRPLPFDRSDRLVRLVENIPASESISGAPERTDTMAPDVYDGWRANTRTLSHIGLFLAASMTLRRPHDAVRLTGWTISPAVLAMLRVPPAQGRLFTVTDDGPGAERTLILSDRGWRRYFDGDSRILGRVATLDGHAYRIVGVMPPDFQPFDTETDFWTPLVLDRAGRGVIRTGVLARLADDVSLAAAQQEADALSELLLGVAPAVASPGGAGLHRVEVVRWKDELVAPVRLSLPLLLAATVCVLLVASVNVSHLFAARAIARRRDVAVRMALGASRLQIVRQSMVEGTAIGVAAGAVGIVVVFAAVRVLAMFARTLGRLDLIQSTVVLPRIDDVGLDGVTCAYAIAVAAFAGLACAAATALHLPRRGVALAINAAPEWRDNGGGARARRLRTSAFGISRPSTTLVAVQAALTIALVVTATLLTRSFVRMLHTDRGYEAASVLTFQLAPADVGEDLIASQARAFARADALLARMRVLPQVVAAGYTTAIPMVQGRYVLSLTASTTAPPTPVDGGQALVVSPDYLGAIGTRLVAGRGFEPADEAKSSATFVITRSLARGFFADGNPIGRHVALWSPGTAGEIVGVVDDIRSGALDSAPAPLLFMTRFQTREFLPVLSDGLYFAVHVDGAPLALVPALRDLARQVAPDAPLQRVAALDRILADSLQRPRSYASVFAVFAGIAALMVAVGLYGVVSFVVGQRTREIGIRMAIGARPFDVVRLVAGESLLAIAVGAAAGVWGAAALARYMQSLLFGVDIRDASTYVAAAIGLLAIGATAAYVPARRASRANPTLALRAE